MNAHDILNAAREGQPVSTEAITQALRETGDLGPPRAWPGHLGADVRPAAADAKGETMTPELAYEKRYADVDNGAHTWAVAPQHVKDMWLAAWTISDAVNREDERQRLLAELRTMHAQQNGRHNYYLYAAELLAGKL